MEHPASKYSAESTPSPQWELVDKEVAFCESVVSKLLSEYPPNIDIPENRVYEMIDEEFPELNQKGGSPAKRATLFLQIQGNLSIRHGNGNPQSDLLG